MHPQPCRCEHVQGYLARERDGGGIPTIERIAGDVLSRDYGRLPMTGSQVEADEMKVQPEMEQRLEMMEEEEQSTAVQNAIPLRRRA